MADDMALGYALGQDNNSGFGGGGMWIFALLILLGLLNGGFGGMGARGGSPVTEADLCSANSFSELKGSVGRLSDQVGGAYTGLQNGISNLGYETLKNFNGISTQMASCCCETNRNIDSVKFDMANYVASINATSTANTQKVLDAICGNRMADMQNQINQLQLQSALCGVVRYPNSITYGAGASPFCNTSCGCC